VRIASIPESPHKSRLFLLLDIRPIILRKLACSTSIEASL